jgi:hypothetical protein
MLALVLALGFSTQAPPAADPAAVYAELGLPVPAGKLPPLPASFAPDAILPETVRLNPDRFPVRAAVLDGVAALAAARKVAAKAELHESETTDKAKAKLVDLQEDIAAAMLLLNEASAALAGADGKRERSKRWLAHRAYLSAAVALQAAHLDELNLAYGAVRSGRLPELKRDAGQTGWRLVPADKMLSKPAVRQQDEAAREQLDAVAKSYPNTPWAALATADRATKPGLAWEPAAVKPPPPPAKGKKPKK